MKHDSLHLVGAFEAELEAGLGDLARAGSTRGRNDAISRAATASTQLREWLRARAADGQLETPGGYDCSDVAAAACAIWHDTIAAESSRAASERTAGARKAAGRRMNVASVHARSWTRVLGKLRPLCLAALASGHGEALAEELRCL
jgi:hypothetical protein